MSDVGTSFLVGQLVHIIPTLLVCLIAAVLAIVYMGRARGPSILTLMAVLLLAATTLIVPLVHSALLEPRHGEGLDHDTISSAMALTGVLSSFAHTLSLSLLVAAVFVGRRPSAPVDPRGAGTA